MGRNKEVKLAKNDSESDGLWDRNMGLAGEFRKGLSEQVPLQLWQKGGSSMGERIHYGNSLSYCGRNQGSEVWKGKGELKDQRKSQ